LLNRQYRGKDKPTDVLSFPLADELQPFLLGDVVISVETAARQAQRRGHSLPEELQVLLIHGILHLLGDDHEISRSEAIRMRRKEREVKAVLANPTQALSRTPFLPRQARSVKAQNHSIQDVAS